VHGNCVSAGCYAMTDPVITEIWSIVTASLKNGQKRFHVHAFPFRMTEINLAINNDSHWFPFWKTLKPGYDIFEKQRIPPRIEVCNKNYIATQGPDNNPGSTTIIKNCNNLSTANL
ncbi:MAG: L,D-transpeptidase family protein, partial [Methyloligellaceae bacterium]